MPEATARTSAWWIWLLAHAGLLGLFAAGIPLAGGYPKPVEATAPLALAIAELILGVMLAPALVADWRSAWNAAWVGLLFHAIGGALAGASGMEIVPLVATVVIWLAVAGLSATWPLARLALWFAVIAGPVLYYARIEYAHVPTSPHFWAWAWSPTVGICPTPSHPAGWRALLVGSALLAVVHITRRGETKALALYCKDT